MHGPSRGDINAFFGLMLDNIGDMILMASLLVDGFGLPAAFVLTRMIPGTAAGVLVGDLIFTAMAFRLARRTGRSDVTAMPLGLDTPSTFGAVLFIIGPAFMAAIGRGLEPDMAARACLVPGHRHDPRLGNLQARSVRPLSGWIRRLVPRAGLLGSLDSDRAGLDQLPAAARHRRPAGGRACGAGPDPGDPDGALATAARRPRVRWRRWLRRAVSSTM